MKGRHSKGSGNRRNKGQKGSHWQRSETATWANERQYDTWAGPQQVNVGGSQVSPYGDYGGWFYHGQPDQYNQYHHGYQSPEWHPGFGSIAAGCPTLSPCWSHLYQAPQIATFAGFPSEAGSSSSSQAFQTRPLSGFDSPAQPPWPSFLQASRQGPRRPRQAPRQGVSTLVLHNVPARLNAQQVLEILLRSGGRDIDFFYLPYRSRQRRYSRYAFINFRNVEAANAFRARWQGHPLVPGETPLALGNAHTQGLAANLYRYLHQQPALAQHAEGQLSTPIVLHAGRIVNLAERWEQISQRLTHAEWDEVYRQAQGTPALLSGSRTGVYHL